MTFFEEYMGESTWNLSLKLGCPKDENKGVMSKGNLVEGLAWDSNLRERGIREGPLRETVLGDGKGEMVGTKKEVNEIFNCPRIMNHKKLVSKNLMGQCQKKENNIESQTSYNGFAFNAFLLLKNEYYNVGLNFVINFGINFIDFHFMVLLMCAHTK